MNIHDNEVESRCNRDVLQLEVKNFGPIVEGTLDLRPLTVFIGPSNTGKSYMAILIYALHKLFTLDSRFIERILLKSGQQTNENRFVYERQELLEFVDWVKQSFGQLESEEELIKFVHSNNKIASIPFPEIVIKLMQYSLNIHGVSFRNQIQRCFGMDIERLIRIPISPISQILVRRQISKNSKSADHRLTFNLIEKRVESKLSGELDIELLDIDNIFLLHEFLLDLKQNEQKVIETLPQHKIWRLILNFVRASQPNLVGALHLPAFYLPADRTGVMHAHSVVVSALIESASLTGLGPSENTPLLSGVLADFLEQLIYIDSSQESPKAYSNDLAACIEKEILGGAVHVEKGRNSGYPRFTYRPNGWANSLPLMNASSMVSELAPVVLFLRHKVTSKSVLIVEEPESHLHPAMQVEFIRQIAALVRTGTRVIVITHSEYVLEELSNIVQRSKLCETDFEQINGIEPALHPHEVGVWLFKPKKKPKGSVIREVHFDDSNLYSSEFDDVAIALHNDWVEISNRTEQQE